MLSMQLKLIKLNIKLYTVFLMEIDLKEITKASWELAATQGLSGLTTENLAQALSCPHNKLKHLFPDQQAHILLLMLSEVDREATDLLPSPFAGQAAQEILFDQIMTYLDVIKPHHQTIKGLWDELWCEPITALPIKSHLSKILERTLEQASIDTAGWLGYVRIEAFTVFCLYILNCWVNDSTPNQEKTMAALDQGLRKLEKLSDFSISEFIKENKGIFGG